MDICIYICMHVINGPINPSIDHQSTSNDWLKPFLTTGMVNMSNDHLFANLGF